MKRFTIFCSLCCIALSAALTGGDTNPLPWDLGASFISVSKASIDEPGREDEKISYMSANGIASYTYYFNNDESGIEPFVGYQSDRISWNQNPAFTDKRYNNIFLGVSGFTDCIDQWNWKANAYAAVDSDDVNFSKRAIYGGMIWGRYTVNETLDAHIGAIGNFGIEKDTVSPIIGFSLHASDSLTFNLVYPTDMSAQYAINDLLTIDIAGRIFSSRHRLANNAAEPEGIFEYRNRGAELGLTYTANRFFTARVYGGYTSGGDLKVRDKNGDNPTFYTFKGSAYYGGSFDITF